jgi:hypothetical protein
VVINKIPALRFIMLEAVYAKFIQLLLLSFRNGKAVEFMKEKISIGQKLFL